jgi:1,4-alpha-glucan branching enzyme
VGLKHEEMKVISYERAGLLFLFNFHPTHSHQDVYIPVRQPGLYKAVLDSDLIRFGGTERNTPVEFFSKPYNICGVQNAIQVCWIDCEWHSYLF